MNNINLNVTLASSFNKEENSIDNIVNEIDYLEDGNDVAVVSIINGTCEERLQLKFDYYIRKVSSDGEDEFPKKKFLYLFSTKMISFDTARDRKKYNPSNAKACYPNWFFALDGENLHINFPGRGYYELEVFNMNNTEENDAKCRYKEYRENRIEPKALYCFKVK